VVKPVTQDARGIIDAARMLANVRFERVAPPPVLAGLLDRFWLVTWDRGDSAPFDQSTLPHPVVNLVFQHGGGPAVDGCPGPGGTVYGVQRARMVRRLAGSGRVVAAMFRPAGFRGLLDAPLQTITDRWVPAADVLGPDSARVTEVLAGATADRAVPALADLLERRAADRPLPAAAADLMALTEQIAADPALTRVEQLAAAAGVSVRQLQRAFAEHVGASPKWVIRRYRLLEAAEHARRDPRPDWAGVAGQLGYSDQAHLVRDFTRLVGVPPARYARTIVAPPTDLPGLAG